MQPTQRDLVLLTCLEVLGFAVANIVGHEHYMGPKGFTMVLMIIVLLSGQYMLYRVTVSYTRTRSFKILYGSLLTVQFILNGIVNRDVPIANYALIAPIAYTLSLVVFCFVFYFVVQDMFANKHETTYSLLAATVAYLLMAAMFGYLFSIIALKDPTVLGNVTTGVELIQRAFLISHYVIAGFDVPGNAGEVIRNAAVIEALAANLYIIFVVGRLMANHR